jgi:3-hydroxyisobutyrate dehydrogenase/glyoxylate/succinic semialdehyde reductase
MAAEATRRKVRFLDAPVSGSAPLAADGKLTFWIGGEGADLEEVRSLLLYMGNRIAHLGPHGSGSAMKLVVNLLLGTGMAAFAEATVLAEGMGLPVRVVFDSLAGMPQIAPFVLSKRNKIENADYRPEFQLSSMQKDLHLASVTAYETGVALPLTDSAKELYRLAMRNGHAEEDFSAIYGYLASNGNAGTSERSSNNTVSPKPVRLRDEKNSQRTKVQQQAA